MIRDKLGWDYSQTLEEGIQRTYGWIKEQLTQRYEFNGVDKNGFPWHPV